MVLLKNHRAWPIRLVMNTKEYFFLFIVNAFFVAGCSGVSSNTSVASSNRNVELFSMTSNNSTDPSFAQDGDIIQLSITTRVPTDSMTVAVRGLPATVTKISSTLYEAQVTLPSPSGLVDGGLGFTTFSTTPSGDLASVIKDDVTGLVLLKNTAIAPTIVSILEPESKITEFGDFTIQAEGLASGDSVEFFDGEGCESSLGVAVADTEGAATLSASVEKTGAHKIHSRLIDRFGSLSDCSVTSVRIIRSGLPFESIWVTTDINETVTLPLPLGFDYFFVMDWGDGKTSEITSHDDPDRIHTFENPGPHTLIAKGLMESISFDNEGDKDKIIAVTELGDMGWKNFSGAFHGCSQLVEVSGGVTDQVESLFAMFFSAPLVQPDASTWDTSNVRDMSWVFGFATSANADTSGWNTAKVSSMRGMFMEANSATPVTSSWITTNVTDMELMFANTALANPDTSTWDTSNVESMNSMFFEAVTANPITADWDTSQVSDMGSMFDGSSVADPDTLNWNVSNVIDFSSMFARSSANPDTSLWTVQSGENFFRMFLNNTVANPNTAIWEMVGATDVREMFRGATAANPNVANWSLDNITNLTGMFRDATSANPDVSEWDTSNFIILNAMFLGAASADPDVSAWNTIRFSQTNDMFREAIAANPIVTDWDVSRLLFATRMFMDATNANPDLSSWVTTRLRRTDSMFEGATSAVVGDLTSWDVDSVDRMNRMFFGATLANPNMSNWNVQSVTTMEDMFSGSALDIINYSSFLIQAEFTSEMEGVQLDAPELTPDVDGAAARTLLIDEQGWIINDGTP